MSFLLAILRMEMIQENYCFVSCFLSFHEETAFNYSRGLALLSYKRLFSWLWDAPFLFRFQRLLFQLEFLTTTRNMYQDVRLDSRSKRPKLLSVTRRVPLTSWLPRRCFSDQNTVEQTGCCRGSCKVLEVWAPVIPANGTNIRVWC